MTARHPRRGAALAMAAALCVSCSEGGAGRPSVGVLMRSFDDPLCAGSRKAMEAAASGRVDLSFADSRGRPGAQGANFDALVSRKARAVAIDPVDELSARALVIKAKEKGIPIVFFGSRPGDDSMRSWDKVFYVGADASEAGLAQAEMLAARWKADPSADRNRDGRMQLVVLAGESGLLQAARRAEYAVKGLEAADVPTDELAEERAGGSRAAAKEKMAALIARFGDGIEAVACYDDRTALGAIDACEGAGFYKGKRRIPIVGVCDSGDAGALGDVLASGKLLGTAFLDAAAVGREAISLAAALATGQDPSKSGAPVQDAKYVRVHYRALTR